MNWKKILKGPISLPVALSVLAAAPFVGIALHYFLADSAGTIPTGAEASAMKSRLSTPQKLSKFNLTDDTNQTIDINSFTGKWSFVLLGFTHCPDVCPFALSNLAVVHKKMSETLPSDALPSVLFVSVDPKRDQPQNLNQYVQYFNPNFGAATGSTKEIDRFVTQIGGYYKFGPKRGAGAYEVTHSAEIFVIDPSGRVFAKLNPPLDPNQMTLIFKSLVTAYEAMSKSSYAKTTSRGAT